ncbi:hypothetical protein J4447_04575 [Candidatus Pacearchaeota archaeon]|nr:hypothetical protein [Candidatus Pacearchaeota archaeon]
MTFRPKNIEREIAEPRKNKSRHKKKQEKPNPFEEKLNKRISYVYDEIAKGNFEEGDLVLIMHTDDKDEPGGESKLSGHPKEDLQFYETLPYLYTSAGILYINGYEVRLTSYKYDQDSRGFDLSNIKDINPNCIMSVQRLKTRLEVLAEMDRINKQIFFPWF